MGPRTDTLLELLERYRLDLRRAFGQVPAAGRETRPADDEWSAANVIEHLVSTERGVTGVIVRFVAGAPSRDDGEPFDRERFDAHVDLPAFLDRSRKVRGAQPTGDLNGAETWEALEASRRDLLAVLEQAGGRRLEDVAHLHPATGRPLGGYQWIAFVALHEGRHARQIEAISASLT
jgi:hypothetical protein